MNIDQFGVTAEYVAGFSGPQHESAVQKLAQCHHVSVQGHASSGRRFGTPHNIDQVRGGHDLVQIKRQR
ncbi:hypothetical protein KNE206_69840 [Kitasatospora sp. NE20-6]